MHINMQSTVCKVFKNHRHNELQDKVIKNIKVLFIFDFIKLLIERAFMETTNLKIKSFLRNSSIPCIVIW